MEKITFKEKWLNKSPINYNNVSINKIDVKHIVGVYTENETQVLLAFDTGKLLFLDALTFKEYKTPLKLEAASKMHSNRIAKFIIEGEFIYLIRHIGVLEMWSILQRKMLVSQTLSKDVDTSEVKLQKFDNILQLEITKKKRVMYNYDASTLHLINQLSILPHKDSRGVKIKGDEVPLKLNGRWVIIVDQEATYQRGNYYIYDALTCEMITEIPADSDPENKVGRCTIYYNKAGEPLLIKSLFGTNRRGYVYNLNHIDQGFQYFKDYSTLLGEEYFGKETRYIAPIAPEYAHLYKDCSYLTQAIVLCDFNGETVAIENRSGKMWSPETLEPTIRDAKPPKYIGSNQALRQLYPVKLPNGQTGIITNWGELWNPLGEGNDSISTSFIRSATINKQAVFVACTATGFLVLYDTLTGKELCRSEKLNHDVREMLLAQIDGKDIVVVCSEKGFVEHYVLSDLQKTGTSYQLKFLLQDGDGSSLNNMYIVPFENKLQLFASVDYSQIFTWDLLTGEPIHYPLEIAYQDENEDEELFLDGGYTSFECKLFYQNNQPFLGINVSNVDNAFLWDLNKRAYMGSLDLFDKKLEKYADEYTSNYNLFDFEPVHINGQDLILTISGTGVFAFFDPKTLLRVGPVKSTEIEYEKIHVISHNGQQLIVAKSYLTFYIFDLLSLKIVKKFTFGQNISAYTISDGHIIIASGEEIVAYEMQ